MYVVIRSPAPRQCDRYPDPYSYPLPLLRKESHTFIIGAQKCTVFGPTGLFHSPASLPDAALGGSTLAGFSAADWYVRRWAKRVVFWVDWRAKGWKRMARRPKRADMLAVVSGEVMLRFPGEVRS